LPFHGAFLFHEIRVHGHHCARIVPLPIPWVDWLDDTVKLAMVVAAAAAMATIHEAHWAIMKFKGVQVVPIYTSGGCLLRSRISPVPGSSAPGRVFIPKNPFTNPAALQALKKSFAK